MSFLIATEAELLSTFAVNINGIIKLGFTYHVAIASWAPLCVLRYVNERLLVKEVIAFKLFLTKRLFKDPSWKYHLAFLVWASRNDSVWTTCNLRLAIAFETVDAESVCAI